MSDQDQELREIYLKEPWGKILIQMGKDPVNTESSARSVAEYAATRIEELIAIIRGLMESPHADLSAMVYQVRESEGLGWDGPAVKAWSDAYEAARKVIDTNATAQATPASAPKS